MLFNGELVNVGDTVFDINRGLGSVIRVADPLFEVAFGSLRIYYNKDGIQRSRAQVSLYWSKPYIISPAKSQALSDKKVTQFNTILQLLSTLN